MKRYLFYIFLILLLFSFPKVHAIDYRTGATISPPSYEYMGVKGSTFKNIVKVSHQNKEITKFKTSTHNLIKDKEVKEVSGSVILDESVDLSKWIIVDAFVNIMPNETKEIPFIIKVPTGAGTGNYIASLSFTPISIGGKILDSNESRVGLLIMLTVKDGVIQNTPTVELISNPISDSTLASNPILNLNNKSSVIDGLSDLQFLIGFVVISMLIATLIKLYLKYRKQS